MPRFYLGELRQPTDPKDEPVGLPLPGRARPRLLGRRLCDLYLCSRALYDRLWKDGPIEERYWAGGFPAGEWREHDQLWIGILVWLQLGYPIVSALEFAWVQAAARGWFKMTKVGADSYPAALSFTKDLLYGVLDVLTKGGLAMYTSSRAAYL